MTDAAFINDMLKDYMPSEKDGYGKICDAMNYSVFNGGKRLRAIMLIEAFRLFCNDIEAEKKLAYPFAAALECIHGYSLVHDDLPAMDNDMYRRGQLTTHVKYGHAMGVLTGDALLNYSMEIVTGLGCSDELSDDERRRTLKAMKCLYDKAGYNGMIGGQVLDTDEYEGVMGLTKEQLLKVYELKTSMLFEASLCCGAILAGAQERDVKILEDVAYKLGLAFQIMDDVLDVTSTLEEMGKDVNNDAKNNKFTYVSAVGVNQARKAVIALSDEAVALLDGIDADTTGLKELLQKLASRVK